MNENNNAATITVPSHCENNPTRRSLILLPLGPSDFPPVFNLALNLDGARQQFLVGIDHWLAEAPDTAHLVHRLSRCCQHHLALISPNPENASPDDLRKQSAWFEEIFAMIPPVDRCEGTDLVLVALTQQLAQNQRHERVVSLLAYLGEMICGMLCSHRCTSNALTSACRSYVILNCLSAVLTTPRQRAITGTPDGCFNSKITQMTSAQQQQQQNTAFGASISVTGGNVGTALDALKLYQETLCRWGVATVEFEHSVIYYSGDEKPQNLKDHIETQEAEHCADLILHQTHEESTKHLHHRQQQLHQEQQQHEVKHVNSVTNMSFEDQQSSQSEKRNSKILHLKGLVKGEETVDASSVYVTAVAAETDQNFLKRVPTEETIEDIEDLDIQPFKELDFEPHSTRRPYILSISLGGGGGGGAAYEDATVTTERSLVGAFQLKDGHPVQVSIVGGTENRRTWAMEEMKKCFEKEEAQTFVAGKLIEDILGSLDADVVCMDVHGPPEDYPSNHELDTSSTTIHPSYLLSVTFSGCEDCESTSSDPMGRRSTTVGAFNLKDGAPIHVMISGGSAIRRQCALVQMRKKLQDEEAATFFASKKMHDLIDSMDVSVVTVGVPRNEDVAILGAVEDDDTSQDTDSRVCIFKIKNGAPQQNWRLDGSRLIRWQCLTEKRRVLTIQEAAAFLADKEKANGGVRGFEREGKDEFPMQIMRQVLMPGNCSPPIDMGPAKVMVIAKESDDGTLVAQIITELVLKKPLSGGLKKIECSVDVMMPQEVALEEFY